MPRARTRRLLVAVTLAALAAIPRPAAAAPKRLTVLTPTAPWSSECKGAAWRKDKVLAERCSVLETIADEARSGAVAALRGRPWTVMTKENTALLLKQNGGDGTCGEGECAVETAKLAGADDVVSATVTEVEGTWFVTLKLHDVASANLLDTAKLVARTQVEVILGVQSAAAALVRRGLGLGGSETATPEAAAPGPDAGRFEDAPATVVARADDVVVSFASVPPGASVRVDGELLCPATPCRKRVAAGVHEATFELDRHGAVTRRFTTARGAKVDAKLAPRFAVLSVDSTPAGVAVTVDGVEAGKTPVSGREVDEGTVEVAVSDRCFLRSGERVRLKGGERRTVRLAAKRRLAGLKVEAEDARGNAIEAPVKVDGVKVGVAGAALEVPLCAERVEVAIGKNRIVQDLALEEGKVTVVAARPEAGLALPPLVGTTRALYGVGLAVAKSLTPFALTAPELEIVRAAARDAWAGRPRHLLDAALQQAVNALARKRSGTATEADAAALPATRAETERVLYGVGVSIASSLEAFALAPAELDVVLQSMRDGASRRAKLELDDALQGEVNALAKERAAKAAEAAAAREKAAAPAYLARMAKERGAQKTASGAIVIVARAGTGASPTATDKVKVHYTGTLISGKVFDSSASRGPAEFPLNQVIKCWTEGLQLMRVGGKAKLVCPAEAAYGEKGVAAIPGNAVLTFDVELLDIPR